MACLEPRVMIYPTPMWALYHDKEKRKAAKKFINVYSSGLSYEFWQQEIDRINSEKFSTEKACWTRCGKCDGCHIDDMKQWAIRCLAENATTQNNYFVTLTLNDANLTFKDEITSPETGCTYTDDGSWGATLNYEEDFQPFEKRLRRHFEYHYHHQEIRFFMCGEYGGLYGRPHYHAIFFNLPLNDLKPWKLTPEGYLYTSETLEKIWGKGFVTVAEVTQNTCSYVAGYVMKKIKSDWGKEYYYQEGRIPEFRKMSRRPGIGKTFYDQHKDEIYENDEIIIDGMKYSKPQKPPKYFDNIFDNEKPIEMMKIKAERQKQAKISQELEDSKSTLTRAERYELKKSNLQDKTKILKRRANIEADNRKCKII